MGRSVRFGRIDLQSTLKQQESEDTLGQKPVNDDL